MSNANVPAIFQQGIVQLPAEIEQFYEENANILPPLKVNSLSYSQKHWSITVDGATQMLTKKNAEGDDEPIQILRVVILDAAARRGRHYYETDYDKDNPTMPVCWSEDGIAPHSSSTKLQSAKCSDCPMAAKNSKVFKIAGGGTKGTTACSQYRLLCVIPATTNLDYVPLRFKIAITSDWDGQSPDHAKALWFGFSNYAKWLSSFNIKHTSRVVTKLRFDPNADQVKVEFQGAGQLTVEQVMKLMPVIKSEEVKRLISGAFTPNGVDGKALDVAPPADENEAAAVEEPEPEEVAPQETEEEREEREAAETLAAAQTKLEEARAKKAATAKVAPTKTAAQTVAATTVKSAPAKVAPKAAPVVVKTPAKVVDPVEDDDEPTNLPAATAVAPAKVAKANGKAPAKPKAAAAPVETEEEVVPQSDDELSNVLADWDN